MSMTSSGRAPRRLDRCSRRQQGPRPLAARERRATRVVTSFGAGLTLLHEPSRRRGRRSLSAEPSRLSSGRGEGLRAAATSPGGDAGSHAQRTLARGQVLNRPHLLTCTIQDPTPGVPALSFRVPTRVKRGSPWARNCGVEPFPWKTPLKACSLAGASAEALSFRGASSGRATRNPPVRRRRDCRFRGTRPIEVPRMTG